MELKKYYTINYEQEKRRIEEESIPLKKDIMKIEAIEKTWDNALSIGKAILFWIFYSQEQINFILAKKSRVYQWIYVIISLLLFRHLQRWKL